MELAAGSVCVKRSSQNGAKISAFMMRYYNTMKLRHPLAARVAIGGKHEVMNRPIPLPPILPTRQDGVLTITLNRPEARNALSESLMRVLKLTLDEAVDDKAVIEGPDLPPERLDQGCRRLAVHRDRAEAEHRASPSRTRPGSACPRASCHRGARAPTWPARRAGRRTRSARARGCRRSPRRGSPRPRSAPSAGCPR